jgi:hypothetical protein
MPSITLAGVPAATATVGNAYSFAPTVTVSNPQGNVSFTVVGLPDWAAFDATTGTLAGTPSSSDLGSSGDITITAVDGTASATIGPFDIVVLAGSPIQTAPPVITGTPPSSVVAGERYSFAPTASGKGTLTFSIINCPPWAAFDTSTGTLSGTPTRAQVGEYSAISITVSNGSAAAALPTFSISVKAPTTTVPVIGGTPATQVTAGHAYVFQPTVEDTSGRKLTFSVTNKPSWATFDSTIGKLAGTPTAAQTGTYKNIVISVSDSLASAALKPFTITVTPAQSGGSNPVTIRGAPATSVVAGAPYSFKPSATDPDGVAVTFSIVNKPIWATFARGSGTLSGTPNAAQEGTYPDIVISASDGSSTASLDAFAITVTTGNTESVTLTWVAPTLNTDGTPVTELAGYRIYYGKSAAALTQTVALSGANTTSYQFTGLTHGTYYFAVSAFNAMGVDSARSNVATKTIN